METLFCLKICLHNLITTIIEPSIELRNVKFNNML